MTLGTNYARGSIKNDLRVAIGFIRLAQGWTLTECAAEWKTLKRKSVAEIQAAKDAIRTEAPK